MTHQQRTGAPAAQHTPRHLLHVFATFAVGGAQVRVCDLINHFGEKYKHTIVALDGDHSCRSRLRADLDVKCVTPDYDKRRPLATLRVFRRALRRLRPDVLLTYNWGAIEWGLVNWFGDSCPHLHAEDGFGPDEATGQKPRRVWARRVILSRARRIVVPSRLLEKIAREIWHFPASRVTYIPNGVNLEEYARHAAQPDPAASLLTWEGLTVGTVATLRKEKNLPRLLRVFVQATANRQGPPARLVIVGSGPEHAALSRLVAEEKLDDKVILLGHQNNPAATVRAFDVFALSSDTEQMPISILEAMAASLPVVGTDVGDVREMIAPENRPYLSPVADERQFAQNLEALLQDAALRADLGSKNRLRCEAQFDKNKMFAAYERLYDFAD